LQGRHAQAFALQSIFLHHVTYPRTKSHAIIPSENPLAHPLSIDKGSEQTALVRYDYVILSPEN